MDILLDDERRRTDRMCELLGSQFPEFAPVVFDNAPELIARIARRFDDAALVSLDHDLGVDRIVAGRRLDPGTGRHVVDALARRAPSCPVIVHFSNGPAAEGMMLELEPAGWTCERVFPMRDLEWITDDWLPTVRRLLSRKSPGAEA